MNTQDFTKTIVVSKSAAEVYETLKNVKAWWSGLYNEDIKGESERVGDEFSFSAGEGVHYSKQRLIELEPGKKVVWLVTDSNLSFLQKPDEWNGSRIRFDIAGEGDKAQLTFTHEGLVPAIECYGQCTSAWTAYLDNLEKQLQ
ncbi:MAG: SRPBCC domain-containing protein [Bacteroidota bacterium]